MIFRRFMAEWMDLLGGCFLTAIMSPIKHVRVRLIWAQKKKLLEDSVKPGFDAVKAAKDYGIGLSTLIIYNKLVRLGKTQFKRLNIQIRENSK